MNRKKKRRRRNNTSSTSGLIQFLKNKSDHDKTHAEYTAEDAVYILECTHTGEAVTMIIDDTQKQMFFTLFL